MKANKRISFHYEHQPPENPNRRQFLTSHHIISSAQLIRFNYHPPLEPRHSKLQSFPMSLPLDSYPTSTPPLSVQPDHSVKTSKGINLLISKKNKTKQEMKVMSKLMSVDLKVHSSLNESREAEVKNTLEKASCKNEPNPQSSYTYAVPNHIRLQPHQLTCDLFSACSEPIQEEYEQQAHNQQVHPEYAREIEHEQEMIDDSRKFPIRQKIFQAKGFEYESRCKAITMFEPPEQIRQRDHSLDVKISSLPIQNQPSISQSHKQSSRRTSPKRRRLFSQINPPRKLFNIVQSDLNSSDIPLPIISKWQNLPCKEIKQWSLESPTLNGSPE